MKHFSWPQIEGFARAAFALAGTYATQKGWVTADEYNNTATALVGLISVAWSMYSNRPKALIEAAASTEVVKKIELSDPALAVAVPSAKVVADK